MKSKLLLCSALFLIFSNILHAQRIVKYYNANWKDTTAEGARFISVIQPTDSGWARYDYYASLNKLQMQGLYEDSSCKIPNGTFYYVFQDGKLKNHSNYIHGKKEGVWFSFHPNGSMADSVKYVNDRPVGNGYSWYSNGSMQDSIEYHDDGSYVFVEWFRNGNLAVTGRCNSRNRKERTWMYYDESGFVAAKERYENGHMMDKQYFNNENITIDTTLNKNKEAEFPDGEKAWTKYFSKHLYFPDQYKLINSNKVQVVVDFTIGTDGSIMDAYVSVPFADAFDKIALKAISGCKIKWHPAVLNNRNVEFHERQMVTYNDLRN